MGSCNNNMALKLIMCKLMKFYRGCKKNYEKIFRSTQWTMFCHISHCGQMGHRMKLCTFDCWLSLSSASCFGIKCCWHPPYLPYKQQTEIFQSPEHFKIINVRFPLWIRCHILQSKWAYHTDNSASSSSLKTGNSTFKNMVIDEIRRHILFNIIIFT